MVWSNCRYGVQILILYVYKQACEILRNSILKMKYSKTKRTNSCKMVSQTAVTMCDSSIGNKQACHLYLGCRSCGYNLLVGLRDGYHENNMPLHIEHWNFDIFVLTIINLCGRGFTWYIIYIYKHVGGMRRFFFQIPNIWLGGKFSTSIY